MNLMRLLNHPVRRNKYKRTYKERKNEAWKRLKVDVNPFFEEILQWDYKRTGDFPYDNNFSMKTLNSNTQVQKVPKNYGAIVIVETWEQINKTKTMDALLKSLQLMWLIEWQLEDSFLIYTYSSCKVGKMVVKAIYASVGQISLQLLLFQIAQDPLSAVGYSQL